MSYTELHIGKIKKVDLDGLTVEEWCKRECEKQNIPLNKWNDTYKEALLEEQYPIKVVEANGILWEIEDNEREEGYNEISVLTPNSDGTYNYVMQFYNGGNCLSEMLKDELKNIKEENNE